MKNSKVYVVSIGFLCLLVYLLFKIQVTSAERTQQNKNILKKKVVSQATRELPKNLNQLTTKQRYNLQNEQSIKKEGWLVLGAMCYCSAQQFNTPFVFLLLLGYAIEYADDFTIRQ